jgi:hypothetical protein
MQASDIPRFLETGGAAIVFASMFLIGGRIHPMSLILRHQRSMLSFSSGIAMAYVFAHVMPELEGARADFVKFTALPVLNEGRAVYFLALVGFLTFYSLDHLSQVARTAAAEGRPVPDLSVKVVSFAGYVFLIAYLLVNNLEESPLDIALYALAMAVHFLTFDHTFREEPGTAYVRRGHLYLAGAAVLGWAAGWAIALPRDVLALMLGFLSGGIIMNSATDELPREKTGEIIPFVVGAVIYALILIPLK